MKLQDKHKHTTTMEGLLTDQAKKLGLSAKETKKALKRAKGSGLISSKLQETMMGATSDLLSPRERLRQRLNQSRVSRGSKVSQLRHQEKEQVRVEERKANAEAQRKNKKKNQAKKLKELEKRLGTVSMDVYLGCLKRLEEGNYKLDDERNKDKNIVALYTKQQGQQALVMDEEPLFSSDDEEN